MVHALLVVDVQNDFLPPDGALAVPAGDEVIAPINTLLASRDFDLVVATRDWHPPDHSSFREQGGPWPPHCVRGTPGAEISDALDKGAIDVVIDKGTTRDAEGYSAFESDDLHELIRERDVEMLSVTGLATDYCVRHTALDALSEGLRVRIATRAVRGIDPDASRRALAELADEGARPI